MPPAAPKAPKTPEQKKRELLSILFMVCAGIVIALPFCIVGIVAGYFFSDKLKKLESLLLVVISSAYMGVRFDQWSNSYYQWYLAVLQQPSSTTYYKPPVLFTLAVIGLFGGIVALLGTKTFVALGIGKKIEISSTVIPNALEIAELSSAVVAGQGMIPSQSNTARSKTSQSKNVVADPKDGFVIGYGKDGSPVMIREDELRYHGLLFGSTGSGKTETIKVIAAGLLDLGWAGTILDLKEDTKKGGLFDWCKEYASTHTMPFQYFALSDKNPKYWFNSLYKMGQDEAKDTIMSAQEFEAAHYRALNDMQLGQLCTLLYAANKVDSIKYPKPSVYDIGRILAAKDIPAAVKPMVALVLANLEGFTKDDFLTVVNPTQGQLEAAVGFSSRLIGMYQSEVGRRGLVPGEGREVLDVTKNGLSYLGLDSLGKGDITRLVSASVMQSMAAYAARRTSGEEPIDQKRFLIIDEANFVNRKLLLNLLSRARSAHIACIVCTQGPTDWEARISGEPDLSSLVQNTNVIIIMAQGEPKNAELCAGLIGMEEKMSITQQVRDGALMDAGSQRAVVEYIVPPDALRAMSIGESIVRVSKPREWRQWVKVVMRDPTK